MPGSLPEKVRELNGKNFNAPALKAVPIDPNPAADLFAQDLIDGAYSAVVFQTAVGARQLLEAAARSTSHSAICQGLSQTRVVARGPKTVEALTTFGVSTLFAADAPHTGRQTIAAIGDADGRVALQEHGANNDPIIHAIVDRGGSVTPVPVYRWSMPDDPAPLREAIDRLIAGQVDFALFTSEAQVNHLFQVAKETSQEQALRESFHRVVIGSVGPITSAALDAVGVKADYEPDYPNQIDLVNELSRRGHDLLLKKRTSAELGVDTNPWRRIDARWADAQGRSPEGIPTTADSVFLKACRREPVPHTPVWIMRQAGRYQRAYREIRAQTTMLGLCQTPELAAEVTLMAVDRLGVDAAIIFADILLPVVPMGLNLDFVKGEGPVIDNPIRCAADLDRLHVGDPAELAYVPKAIELTRRALRPDIALIGFAGSPFTVASYMVEGGKSSNYSNTKTMMHADPIAWNGLMDRLCETLIAYLNAQIEAGADAVQMFDSWAGSLSPDDYRRHVLPHLKRVIDGIRPGTPVINFATGNPALLPLLKQVAM